MPARWSISPVALRTISLGDGTEDVICPKEHTYIDPGRGKRYARVSLYHVNKGQRTWALSLIRGVSFTPLDADAEIINFFEADFTNPRDLLDMTPNSQGWTNARLTRIRNRITAKGGDVTGLVGGTPLIIWLVRLGQILNPNFDPRTYFIAGP